MADSVSEFSLVQGSNNWSYGYCSNAYSPGGFVQFTATANCCGNGDYWWTGENYWTSMWQQGGHPNGLNGNQGHLPAVHLAVRRWISEVTGPVQISGLYSSCDSPGVSCGGGLTRIAIYVGGSNIWEQIVTSSNACKKFA